MKKLLAALVLWASICAPAFAATVYACACGTGAHANCVAGSQTAPYDTPAKSINSVAQWLTSYSALNAGDHLSTCQGGAFNSFSSGNLTNANGTKASPVVVDSYDDSARWSGGGGIRPKFNGTAASALNVFQLAVGTPAHREGVTLKDIEIVGQTGPPRTATGIFLGADQDWVTVDNVKITNTVIAIQCNGGGTSTGGTGDGITEHLTVRNSTITDNENIGILDGCSHSLIEKSTFARNGDSGLDHHIYMSGATTTRPQAQTISSLVGDGTTTTLTTAAPHGLSTGWHFTIGVSGATPSGFNVTGGANGIVGTVTGLTTITYKSTGSGTASVVGTYITTRALPLTDFVIRNNTFSEGNTGAAGSCNEVHLVVHGDWNGAVIENNTFSESVAPSSGGCAGISVSAGYAGAEPEDFEQFTGVTIRGNTVLNLASGIDMDLTVRGLIENNFVACSTSIGCTGIKVRSKNFSAPALFSGTATSATANTLTNSGASFSGLVPGGDTETTVVKIVSGTGAGQRRFVSAFTSTQLTLNPLYPLWSVTPDATSTYVVSNQSARAINAQEPSDITVRNNTVYFSAPTSGAVGIYLSGNEADALTGSHFNLYNNLVVFDGTSATTSSQCFNTANYVTGSFSVLTKFDLKDYNACYYNSGGGVPKWDQSSSLATIQAASGDANRSEQHSIFASTANVSTGQPFFVTSTPTTPAIGTSSAAKNAGHPTKFPKNAWGGAVRNQGTKDIGAFEFGATLGAVPGAPTRIAAP